jgi:hypothetical protein
MRFTPLLALFLLLAGCIPGARPGGRGGEPERAETPAGYRQCLAEIGQLGARVQALPDRSWENGCSATSAVKLVAIGIPVANLGAMKCGLARPFIQWTRETVQQAARARLGTTVTRIDSFGTFACRPVNGQAGNRLSEHGRANAVDIGGFQLANGRRVTVLAGWNDPDPNVRAFLRDLHRDACRRFDIVLGPDANALHRDHFHFDMGSGRYCR